MMLTKIFYIIIGKVCNKNLLNSYHNRHIQKLKNGIKLINIILSCGGRRINENCQTKGLNKEEFNKIKRGYYLNKNLVFYKDNFIYDDDLIEESLKYLKQIQEKVESNQFEIYYGVLPEKNFAFDYHYGKYVDGKVIKAKEKNIDEDER